MGANQSSDQRRSDWCRSSTHRNGATVTWAAHKHKETQGADENFRILDPQHRYKGTAQGDAQINTSHGDKWHDLW